MIPDQASLLEAIQVVSGQAPMAGTHQRDRPFLVPFLSGHQGERWAHLLAIYSRPHQSGWPCFRGFTDHAQSPT